MLAAYKSDFYIIKSTAKFYILAQILMILIAQITHSQYLYLFYPTFASLVIPMNIIAHNSTHGFTGFILSTPIKKSRIVLARYLLLLSFYLPVILVSFTAMTIFKDSTPYNSFVLFIICTSAVLVFNSVFTPITYLVDAKYISFVFMGIFFVPAIVVMFVKDKIEAYFSNVNIDLLEKQITNIYNSPSILLLCLMCSAILFVISALISMQIFKRKEF